MKSPFFTIIIPTYNRADKISIAIHSVLTQSFNDFELIIVDDGSSDKTRDTVLSFQDSRIRYYWKNNEERNIARNFGIEKAHGNYVTFLDSDDYLYPNHFQEAYNIITYNDYSEIIHLGYEIRREDGSIRKTERWFKYSSDYIIKNNFLSCNAIFIRSDIIKVIKFISSKNAIVGEDHHLWLKLMSRYNIVYGFVVTSVIIEHSKRSLNNINVDKLIIGTLEIIDDLKTDNIFISKFKRKANKYFALNLVFLGLMLAGKHKRKEAYKMLYEAFKTYPEILFYKRFIAAFKNTLMLELKTRK